MELARAAPAAPASPELRLSLVEAPITFGQGGSRGASRGDGDGVPGADCPWGCAGQNCFLPEWFLIRLCPWKLCIWKHCKSALYRFPCVYLVL